MVICGLYYRTVSRNVQTGSTGFLITPDGSCSLPTENGLLYCTGKIGIFSKGMPVRLTGNVSQYSFDVTDYEIPTGTAGQTEKLIDYIDNKISDGKRKKIAKVADNDLISFVKRKDAKNVLIDALIPASQIERFSEGTSDSKTVYSMHKTISFIDRMLSRIGFLLSQEELTKKMLACGAAADKIEILCRKEITLSDINKNPYMTLLRFDIPINVCEVLAGDIGIDAYDKRRLCGFVYDALANELKQGNTCVPYNSLINIVNARLSEYSASCMEPVFISKSMLYCLILNLDKYMCLIESDGELFVYFTEVLEEEDKIISNIKRLNTAKHELPVRGNIEEIEEKLNIKYNTEQKKVFDALKSSGIKILTGPPGSGKTAVIRGLMEYSGSSCRLSATTGMAAKVMSKACDAPAETVHRMLDLTPYGDVLRGRDLNDPIESRLIVVDEMSMCGLKLFSALLPAIKSDSILLLVGDEDQLLSVEYGNILHDLIASGAAEVYRLKEVLRQSGSICADAVKINSGDTDLITDDAFAVKKFSDNEKAVEELKKNVNDNSTVLVPIKSESGYGTEYLNGLFQDKSAALLLSYGNKDFRAGDRVVMTNNNYDTDYVNGDMGIITGMNHGRLVVDFDGDIKEIPRTDMVDMDLAYALTVHKSQGSGFDDVHILLPTQAKGMMTRRLLYTAVTRAKKKVTVYDVSDGMACAITNMRDKPRLTLLKKRLEKIRVRQNCV